MIREFRNPWWLVCAATISFAMVRVPATWAQVVDEVQDNNVEPDADASDASAKSKVIPRNPIPLSERSERLQRRAGEKVAGDARGRTVVLGMHIQEADNERAKVVEVGPTSPAFDAGIREDDEIISFDGFKADTYREWVDGMRRLATDAPDGDTLPIILVRDGKRLNLRLRVPESRAGALPQEDPLTLNQQGVPGQPGQPGAVAPGQQPTGAAGGGGDNVLIANAFGDQFNDPNGGTTEQAIAEIFRLNTQPQSLPAGGSAPRGTAQRTGLLGGAQDASVAANASAPGARVGLAGFRNDANGLFVMLDVGGLPPGNYLVGIDDPSVMAGAGNVGTGAPTGRRRQGEILDPSGIDPSTIGPAPTSVPRETFDRQSAPGAAPGRRGAATPSNAPTTAPRDTFDRQSTPGTGPARQGAATPSSSGSQPAGNSQPQSRLQPAERQAEIPRTVLAQVADPSQAGAAGGRPPTGAGPSNTPATGQLAPVRTPTTGRIDQVGTPATGEVNPTTPRTADARREQTPGTNIPTDFPAGSAEPTVRIGMLAVDQSGTGRLQQVVEGVQVQDVIGQAIAIYAQNAGPQQTTLPPNLDPTIDPVPGQPSAALQQQLPQAAGQQPAGATRVRGAAGGAGAERTAVAGTPRGANPATAGVGATVPVAGGLIRLMSDQPTDAGGVPTNETVPGQQTPVNLQNDVQPTVPNAEQIR